MNAMHSYLWRLVGTDANITPDNCETASFEITEGDADLCPELFPVVGKVVTLTDVGQSEIRVDGKVWSVSE